MPLQKIASTLAKMTTQRKLARPVHLILDWDGTLTAKDTLSILGHLPKARDKRLGRNHQPAHSWDDFAEAYMRDYTKQKQAHFPATSDRQAYSNWLASLRDVEYASAKRISDTGYFRGVTAADVANVAQNAIDTGEVQLRNGWQHLFELFLPSDAPTSSKLSILSVNFSQTFIRGCIRHAVQSLHASGKQRQLIDYIEKMDVKANEIEGLDLSEGSTGKLVGEIRTAPDKLRHLPAPMDERVVVYVGDSPTDYECLRRADVGIWICDCAEDEYRQPFSETFKPLDCEATPLRKGSASDGQFYWTRSLGEVAEYLQALKES